MNPSRFSTGERMCILRIISALLSGTCSMMCKSDRGAVTFRNSDDVRAVLPVQGELSGPQLHKERDPKVPHSGPQAAINGSAVFFHFQYVRNLLRLNNHWAIRKAVDRAIILGRIPYVSQKRCTLVYWEKSINEAPVRRFRILINGGL